NKYNITYISAFLYNFNRLNQFIDLIQLTFIRHLIFYSKIKSTLLSKRKT
ncbi:MAG: hypothetical protein RLZZ292_3608, partial [Bacteroidota bacterium]